MAADPKIYRKLPGTGTGGMQRFRLWLGPDHLLQVASTAIGERYKRFYFADIQAFVVRRTAGFMGWSIGWIAAVAFFGIIGATVDGAPAKITFASIAAVFLVLLLIHLAFGPTCECTVRTAVQTEQLVSLKRLGTARRVLARLRPLIEAAQPAGFRADAPVEELPFTEPTTGEDV